MQLGRQSNVAVSLFCCFVFLSGCGGDGPALHALSGTVTKAGKGLEGVTVTLVATEGGFPPLTARTQADGSFRVITSTGRLGAPAGDYKVYLTPMSSEIVTASAPGEPPKNMEKVMQQYAGQTKGRGSSAPKGPEAGAELIPLEYQSADKSPLKITVPMAEEWKIEIP